jgi:hypothetical protein
MYTFIRLFDPSLPRLIELQPAAIAAVFFLDFLWAVVWYNAFKFERRMR